MRFPVAGNQNSCSCLAPAIRPGKSLLLTTGMEQNSSIFRMVAELRCTMWGCPCICFLRTCLFLWSNMQTACMLLVCCCLELVWMEIGIAGVPWTGFAVTPLPPFTAETEKSTQFRWCTERQSHSLPCTFSLVYVKSRRKGGEMAAAQFRILVLCWCRWELLNPPLL